MLYFERKNTCSIFKVHFLGKALTVVTKCSILHVAEVLSPKIQYQSTKLQLIGGVGYELNTK